MKINKKVLIPLILIVFIIGFICIFRTNTYSYSLEKEEKSVVNQYRLYVNNKNGKHVNGKVDVTYLNGKKQTITVDKEGKLIIKSVIKKIDNSKRR